MSSISHRISTMIGHKGMSIRSFEAQAGITQGVLSNAIKKNSDISSINLSKIIDTFDEFDAHWLLTGEGEMLSSREEQTQSTSVRETSPYIKKWQSFSEDEELCLPKTDEFEYVNNDNGGKVPIVNELSFAVYDPDDPSTLKAEEYYYIKDFRNADFMMRVAGDYMYPKYKPGDLIACRYTPFNGYYQWGKTYAILTCHQGILLGRVYEHKLNTSFVTLRTENSSYPEWDIPIDEIARSAAVIGSISLD